MDFLGPIDPLTPSLYGDTEDKYVLIVVDYFSKIVSAKSFPKVDAAAAAQMWDDHLVSIFGFTRVVYTDNGSHFTGFETVTLFESHGTTVIATPICRPESVRLIERMVQMVAAQLRKWAIAPRYTV
ncbi:uncharacterized protein BP5553_02015 [Venustampulla echinocandica]|uniref:Integrase catalytic domain-containing protein n=1 Tax=Venustampulla echinocandica TaxID=2656787 RepID=A0A370U2M8_9HELO|nr:uncharacterized protein BP5553_02015 [Venustampulla echinocandica]RDL42036.1 hypothetical protein BP5553_02015 [Venustampulla echinocandica]